MLVYVYPAGLQVWFWEGKVTGAGGRIEQNYRRLVRGDTAAADVDALATLAKVQKRTLTVV